jgi:hypothetical protein
MDWANETMLPEGSGKAMMDQAIAETNPLITSLDQKSFQGNAAQDWKKSSFMDFGGFLDHENFFSAEGLSSEKQKQYTFMMEGLKNKGLDFSNKQFEQVWNDDKTLALFGASKEWRTGPDGRTTQVLTTASGEEISALDSMNSKVWNQEALTQGSALGGFMDYSMQSDRVNMGMASMVDQTGEAGRTLIKTESGKVVRLGEILKEHQKGNAAATKILDEYNAGDSTAITLDVEQAKKMKGAQTEIDKNGFQTYDAEAQILDDPGESRFEDAVTRSKAAGSDMKSTSGNTYTKYGTTDGINFSPQALIGLEQAFGRALTYNDKTGGGGDGYLQN